MSSRRRYLATVATLGATALSGCTGIPGFGERPPPLGDDFPDQRVTGAATGWPRYRRDEANTACVPDGDPVTDPSVEWRSAPLAISHRFQEVRTLTADGGAVYATDGALQAFGTLSGERLWTQPAARETWEAPTLYDSLAWVGSEDDDNVVLGVDRSTGEVADRIEFPGRLEVQPSVTAADGYFVAPTDSGVVAALRNPPNGPGLYEPEWTQELFGGGYHVATTNSVFAVSYAGELYRFLPRGRPYWRTDLNRLVASGPVVGDRRVYVATEGGAVALLAADGRHVWEYEAPSDTFGRHVAFDGARLYVSGDDSLHAVSAKTGEPVWSVGFDAPLTAAPSVGGDRVYLGTGDTIHALSVEGDEVWSLPIDGGVGKSLALAAGRIYTLVNAEDSNETRIVALG